MIDPATWALTFAVVALVYFQFAPTLPEVQAAYRTFRSRVWGAPPPAAFGVIWTLLFALMATNIVLYARVAATAADEPELYDTAFGLWIANLALVKAWAPLFNAAFLRPSRSQFWLLVAIAALVAATSVALIVVEALSDTRWWLPVLLGPYALWAAYATTLMVRFALLNLDAPARDDQSLLASQPPAARAGGMRPRRDASPAASGGFVFQ